MYYIYIYTLYPPETSINPSDPSFKPTYSTVDPQEDTVIRSISSLPQFQWQFIHWGPLGANSSQVKIILLLTPKLLVNWM